MTFAPAGGIVTARNLQCASRQLIVQQETEIVQANNIGAFYKYINNYITYRNSMHRHFIR